jgi:glycosyltransferase involved in cell wall biosynthesis
MSLPPDHPRANGNTDAAAFAAEAAGPRIAYFSESVLPWVDGVSRTLGHLFSHLKACGRSFRVYSPIAPAPKYAWSENVRRVRSVPFPLYRDYRVSFPDWRWLRADLDAFKPELIHVCAPTPVAIWAQSYARSKGIPVAGSFHTDFAGYMRYYHAGALEGLGWRGLRWFYNRCDATFAPSTSVIDELRHRGVHNVGLWSRGIDCDVFSPAHRDPELRAQLGAGDETPLLLMVSRLVKEKDLADLIEMDRSLKQRGLRYRFALVGDGPFRGALERGLPDARFAGQLVGKELSRWYASADIFVFPSTTETFGNVVQEAMASELGTIVVDKGGPPSLIEHGVTGLVAWANTPRDLASQVETLIKDPARRREMGRKAREVALQRTWKDINGALLRQYDALIAEKRAGQSSSS